MAVNRQAVFELSSSANDSDWQFAGAPVLISKVSNAASGVIRILAVNDSRRLTPAGRLAKMPDQYLTLRERVLARLPIQSRYMRYI